MIEEIWKDVVGYENIYQISNLGRVKALERPVNNRAGKRFEKILKYRISERGYCITVLSKEAKSKKCFIHRLIAQAFIPNPENKLEINHINGIRHDNRIENLEWCTRKENMVHAFSTGLNRGKIGEDNISSKFKEF